MNVDDIYPRRYASGADLQGKSHTVTIRTVTIESLRPAGILMEKPVIWFHETERGVIMSRTMASTIAASFGPDTDTWAGRSITLTPVPVKVAGADRIAIRCSIPPQNGGRPK